jgi:hypothetical protein
MGCLWMIAWSAYTFRSLYPTVSVLGQGILAGLCVVTMAFALNGLTPPLIGREIRPEEIGHPLTFARGPRPEDPVLRSLWRKYRRGLAFAAGTASFMVAWGVAVTFGLMKAR